MRSGLNKSCIWVDGSFNSHKAGIGIDSQWILSIINEVREVGMIYDSPKSRLLHRQSRKLRNLASLIINRPIYTPDYIFGTFFQPQLTSVVAGKNISKWIVRVHDIFPITNPDWFRPWARIIFARSMNFAEKHNALVLCSSETTKKIIISRYSGFNDNIVVLSCFPRKFQKEGCQSCDGCEYNRKHHSPSYFISVGTIEPRKDFGNLSYLWSMEFPNSLPLLIIVGKRGWKCRRIIQKINRASKSNRVVWLENVCDGALNQLYSHALAFISSSLDEGFNLPALEARSIYGIPLILKDIPVHREHHDGSANFYTTPEELLDILFNPLVSSKPWDTSKLEIQKNQFKAWLE